MSTVYQGERATGHRLLSYCSEVSGELQEAIAIWILGLIHQGPFYVLKMLLRQNKKKQNKIPLVCLK